MKRYSEAVVVNNVNGDMSKEELLEMLRVLREENEKLVVKVGEKGVGRKDEVLNLIRSEKRISIKDLGERIGISERNISSQLSYLRKDGYKFGKDSKGRIYEEIDE